MDSADRGGDADIDVEIRPLFLRDFHERRVGFDAVLAASRPSISSSAGTRMPMLARRIHHARNVAREGRGADRGDAGGLDRGAGEPPPGTGRPRSAKRPTLSVPKMPPTRCTLIAPTGSSSLIFSKKAPRRWSAAPARQSDDHRAARRHGLQAAVIATRPVRVPLRIKLRSGFASSSHATTVADTHGGGARHVVLRAMRAIASARPPWCCRR